MIINSSVLKKWEISSFPFVDNPHWQLMYACCGEWGDVNINDVLAVLGSVKKVFENTFGHECVNKLHISIHHTSVAAPTAIKKTNNIFLAAQDRYWVQYAYQFSHELCHIMIAENVAQSFRWFEESICELASLYSLIQLNEIWQVSPPYLHWKDYSSSFVNYYKQRKSDMEKYFYPLSQPFAELISLNIAQLRSNPYLREINAVCAHNLLPIFLQYPSLWKEIILFEKIEDNLTFQEQLNTWASLSSGGNRTAISEIISLF